MKILVTGGAGLLGSHIVELLVCASKDINFADVKAKTDYDDEDEVISITQQQMLSPILKDAQIRVLDLHEKVLNEDEYTRDLFKEAEWIKGDLTNYETVLAAVQGCDAVIHTASVVDFGNRPKELIMNVNINGTKNIIRACKECNVKALVYSSSIEVLQSKEGVKGLDDDIPYVMDTGKPFEETAYLVSKTIAEKAVLAENKSKNDDGSHLFVGVVRPSGMYGERDAVHIFQVLNTAKNAGGSNSFRVGDGSSLFQHVYAGNVAHMHLCVLAKLLQGDESVSGQAFMGIDYTKVNNFFDFFDPYLVAKGYKVPTIHLPIALMYQIARVAEFVKSILDIFFPSLRKVNNVLTKQAVGSLGVDIWFKTDKAKRLTGYEPIVSPMRARSLSIAHFKARTDEFPQGPFTYAENAYNYMDTGRDYTPDLDFVASQKQKMRKKLQNLFAVILAFMAALLYYIKY